MCVYSDICYRTTVENLVKYNHHAWKDFENYNNGWVMGGKGTVNVIWMYLIHLFIKWLSFNMMFMFNNILIFVLKRRRNIWYRVITLAGIIFRTWAVKNMFRRNITSAGCIKKTFTWIATSKIVNQFFLTNKSHTIVSIIIVL